MKCPSCGAEIENGRFCSFCGTQITADMLREKEILNKVGCPSCGSTNVTFNRENQGEVRGENGKQIVHYTVGLCKDCGYTWRADKAAPEGSKPKNKWVALMLCLFLGYFGAHKFYEGKIGMGIVYIFTAGLFLVGIIKDVIEILKRPTTYYV